MVRPIVYAYLLFARIYEGDVLRGSRSGRGKEEGGERGLKKRGREEKEEGRGGLKRKLG